MEILEDANLSYHSYHSSKDSKNQEEEKDAMGELDGYEDLQADESNNSDRSLSFSREENSPVSPERIAIQEQFSSADKQLDNDQEENDDNQWGIRSDYRGSNKNDAERAYQKVSVGISSIAKFSYSSLT